MDLSTIALLILVWKMATTSKQGGKTLPTDVLGGLLSDETKSLIDGVQTLADSSSTSQDKTGAVLNLISNPSVISAVQKVFGGQSGEPQTNEEGYVFPPRSKESQEFFRPIKDVCGSEVTDRLCKFYDNHYVK